MPTSKIIPIIDLFAGPGGLGEGFSAFRDLRGSRRFKIALSVEKNAAAHQTLLLRTFLREFPKDHFPSAYYDFLRRSHLFQNKGLARLFEKFPREAASAKRNALHTELGKSKAYEIERAINSALQGSDEFLLIGGPPCQAYSIAGRSRNKGKVGYKPESDIRQYLYIEYLQVIADHAPALFVMENVKGLLSATLNDELIFERILDDLRNPADALAREGRKSFSAYAKKRLAHYSIHSFVSACPTKTHSLQDFVVRMEKYGIPQTRHRLILLGVRNDLETVASGSLEPVNPIPVCEVLEGLPKLRSGLSDGQDNNAEWVHILQSAKARRWFKATRNKVPSRVYEKLLKTTNSVSSPAAGRGKEFIEFEPKITYRPDWYLDRRMGGVCNHSSRSHMTSDIYRYLYASCFAAASGKSPMMRDFPTDLLPQHKSVQDALNGRGFFQDRFRVQISNLPATTVTSHISKDGHYYIHPDPEQCRSLTVREAARIQTFPDNYFFCGGRTAQYIQVGNAVPPLLAAQLADIIFQILKKTGLL